jgi:hypothetical protein
MLGCAIVLTITVALFVYSPRLAVAVGAIGIGVLLTIEFLDRCLARPRIRSRAEVAAILEAVVDGQYGEIDWGDFIRYRIQDKGLDEIRVRCARLEETCPANVSGRLFSEAGEDVLREIIKELDRAG